MSKKMIAAMESSLADKMRDKGKPEKPKEGSEYKLGSGKKFAALKQQLAQKGVNDPAALAASIGRKKYGAKKFNSLSHKGR